MKLAKEIDADGVHVGQSDMEALDVRAQLGEDKIIGVSARTVEQALLAEKHGADYLGLERCFKQEQNRRDGSRTQCVRRKVLY